MEKYKGKWERCGSQVSTTHLAFFFFFFFFFSFLFFFLFFPLIFYFITSFFRWVGWAGDRGGGDRGGGEGEGERGVVSVLRRGGQTGRVSVSTKIINDGKERGSIIYNDD